MTTSFKIQRTDVSGVVPNIVDSSNSLYLEPGALFINVADEILYSSNGTNYFQVSGGSSSAIITSTFAGNGSNTVFTLPSSTDVARTFVFLNGVAQTPTTDYTVSSDQLTFVTAPTITDTISVYIIDAEDLLDARFTNDFFTGNGSNTVFTLSTSPTSNSHAIVFLGGVRQVPTTDYGISSTTLTFTTAPANNDEIQVVSLVSYSIAKAANTSAFIGDGTTKNFNLALPSTSRRTIISLNGITQIPVTDFTVTGRVVSFISAPANLDKIIARSFYNSIDAGGANGTIQFNDSGDLGGSLGLTFNKTTNNVSISNNLSVSANVTTSGFRMTGSNPPANSTSTGTAGTITWDTSYIYVCVSTNTWKKVAIGTW